MAASGRRNTWKARDLAWLRRTTVAEAEVGVADEGEVVEKAAAEGVEVEDLSWRYRTTIVEAEDKHAGADRHMHEDAAILKHRCRF